MNGKFTKYLAYVFFIGIILLIVLGGADPKQEWVGIVRIIAFSISMLCGLIYVAIITYCIIDNKKIDKYLNNDNYDGLIEYSTKKANKKAFILEGRQNYYKYLLLLCYLAKDETEQIDKYFEELKGQELMFPMISYWKACYKFSINDYNELNECYDSFRNSRDILKAPHKYYVLTSLLHVFILYSENKVKDAKEELAKLDTSTITMPSTLKSIKIVKDSIVNEETLVEQETTNEEESITE